MTQVDLSMSGTVVPCWSCKGPVSPRALFCSTCGAVQPPGKVDHFARLGLAPGYVIAIPDLDRQYFGFQRRLHPDRFATRSPKERMLSQQQATALNEAYETLKDPLKRAVYLLRLGGVEIDQAGGEADQGLLIEAMEMREALEEADSSEAVNGLLADAEEQVEACQSGLADAFAANDLDKAGRLTARLKYLGRLAEEARARKNAMTRQGL